MIRLKMLVLAQGIGNFYFQLNMFEKELKVNEEAIKIYPLSALPWKFRGDILDNLERYDEAINCYDKAIELDNKYIHAWIAKGVSQRNKAYYGLANDPIQREQYYQKAHLCFDQAFRYDNKNINLLKQRGLTLRYRNIFRPSPTSLTPTSLVKLNPSYFLYSKSYIFRK